MNFESDNILDYNEIVNGLGESSFTRHQAKLELDVIK